MSHLEVTLLSGRVHVAFMRKAHSVGLGERVRGLLAFWTGQRPAIQVQHSDSHTCQPGEEFLCLQHLLEGNRTLSSQLRSCSVRVGPAFSVSGLVSVDARALNPSASSRPIALIHAWVAETWAVKDADYVIKHMVLPDQRIFASCILRAVIEDIQAFAKRWQLELLVCTPLFLQACNKSLQGSFQGSRLGSFRGPVTNPANKSVVLLCLDEPASYVTGSMIELCAMSPSSLLATARYYYAGDSSHLSAHCSQFAHLLAAQCDLQSFEIKTLDWDGGIQGI